MHKLTMRHLTLWPHYTMRETRGELPGVLVFPQGTDLETVQCLAHVNAGMAKYSEGGLDEQTG